MSTIKFISPTIRDIIEIIKGGLSREEGLDDDVSWVGAFEGVGEGFDVFSGDGAGEGVGFSVGEEL
ncbi:MAG: hypothetical protein LVT47_08520 [Cyanobacteria bacterium LVE1205-1]|jgi:hypothetical protein